ncbi:MAG: CAP domain-containing protein [Thiotrichales bacterium]
MRRVSSSLFGSIWLFLVAALGIHGLAGPAEARSDQEPATMQGMVQAHNQVRAAVGLAPLRWSTALATYAGHWADHLAVNNGCSMRHRSDAKAAELDVGENLFWAGPLLWSDGRTEVQAVSPAEVALDWAAERADYDLASNRCRAGAQCGHYTQMVWRSTTEVGCGMTVCPDQGQLWVCNYNPPGNWVGEKPY